MKNTVSLIKKEFVEQWRTNKILIITLGFLLLGMQGPIIAKMLPDLIKNSSSSLSGLQIVIPQQTSLDAIISYFNSMAIMPALVMILVAMGTIAGERERGTLVFVLTKPVTRTGLIISKFLSYFAVMALALVVTALAVGYYTVLLFDSNFQIGPYVMLNLTMLVFLGFMLAIIVLASSLFKSGIAAGGVSFVLIFLITNLTRLLPDWPKYSPQVIFDVIRSRQIMLGQVGVSELIVPTLVGVIATVVTLAVACIVAEQREM